MRDILAEEHLIERNSANRSVSPIDRLAQSRSRAGNRQHSAAARENLSVLNLGAAVEYRSSCTCRLKPGNLFTLLVIAGISTARDNDRRRAFVLDDDILFLKATRSRMQKRLSKVPSETRQHRFRLRVAETRVELDNIDARTALGNRAVRIGIFIIDHEPCVKNSTVHDAALLQLPDDWHDDLFLD